VRQDEESQGRARSFGEIAADYDRLRPAPPAEALDWLLPPAAAQVVELGAGTGILTRLLTGRVEHVQAIEPDARMREVLSARSGGAAVVAASAESLPVPDGSADAVIASSAWHWMDEALAVPEVARVLRPGGYFSLLWCGPNRRVDWMRALWAGGQDLTPEEAAALDAGRKERHRVDLGSGGLFSEPETRLMEWHTPMSPEALVGLAGTYSAVITMEPSARDDYLTSLRRYIGASRDLAGKPTIEVPMRCLCWRATRN
jgi:SAM-dependent methyltransferase